MTLKKLLMGGLILAKTILPFSANAEVDGGVDMYTSMDPAIVSTSGNHDNGSLGIQYNFGSNTTKAGVNAGIRFEESFPGFSNVMGGFGLSLEREISPSWNMGLGLERFFSSIGNYSDKNGVFYPNTSGKGKMDILSLAIRKTLFSNENHSFSVGASALYKDGSFNFTPGDSDLEYTDFDFKKPSLEVKIIYSRK